jgi:type I restriction enzyme M protein
MLTNPVLRGQVDKLWDRLWAGGLSNPLDAIEQFSYLLFLKRLDDAENQRARQAQRLGRPYQPGVPEHIRWSYWTRMKADEALRHVRDVIFPWFREMGGPGSSFERYMQNAEFKLNKASLLIEACNIIDQMQISAQNQDVQGDLYEYLLSRLNTAGQSGQFRTPRHIIRMMVQMIDPKPNERMGDLAGGTCGFPVNTYQYILEKHTSPAILTYDEAGWPHNLIGDLLTPAEWDWLQTRAFRAYDNDSGGTMLRIGSMNLMLHGIQSPQFFYMDTLSKAFTEEKEYDLILMNPPFTGKVDKADINPTLPGNTTKSELLFVHLILRALDMGGRCAVIVPDGVLFGSTTAHVELRRKLIEENRLDGVVSMPSGVFRPYAGVSTAVLLFTRGAKTDRIWFYDMDHDGFSLDDKRLPVAENDIPDMLACWRNRHDPAFEARRQARLAELKGQAESLKARRLGLHGEINRLTFESAIAPEGDGEIGKALVATQQELAELQAQISPLQAEINQLGRQFWVTGEQARANKYDLSASRYRSVARDDVYFEEPKVTVMRLRELENAALVELDALAELLR